MEAFFTWEKSFDNLGAHSFSSGLSGMDFLEQSVGRLLHREQMGTVNSARDSRKFARGTQLKINSLRCTRPLRVREGT